MSSIGAMSGGGNAGGVAGQLDVQWIVEQIIYAKQQPIRDLETFEVFYQAKKEAFQELNTRVSAVESSLYTLRSSSFGGKSVELSRSDYMSATATTAASDGEYSIAVKNLAKAESWTSASSGISDPDSQELTDGLVEFYDATNTAKLGEIDFTGGSKSLNELKDEINSLDLGDVAVSAAVVNFGTSENADYRLQVTSENTGTDNGFHIRESGGGTLPGFAEMVDSENAEIYVNVDPVANPGEYISRSNNIITDVIGGVTLNLTDEDSTKTTTLTIDTDSTSLKEDIGTFVTAFNDAIDYLNAQFEFDEENERAGVLSGEATAVKIKNDLLRLATSSVSGIKDTDTYRSFSLIGLELNRTGQLEFDEDDFDEALEADFTGVERVFRDLGTTTTSDVTYIGSTSDTVGGEYTVHVDQVGEQATIAGAHDYTSVENETLSIWYRDTSGSPTTVAITNTMSSTEVVNLINSELDDDNIDAYARMNGNKLEILSTAYGSSETIYVQSDIGAVDHAGGLGAGFGPTQSSDTGQDVAGLIGNNAATGTGRILKGTEGDSTGLSLQVTTTSVAPGGEDRGSVYYTEGVGEAMREQMLDISFPFSGILAKNIDSLDNQLQNIEDKIGAINRSLASQQDILITQFTKANEALAQMSYLQSQLAGAA